MAKHGRPRLGRVALPDYRLYLLDKNNHVRRRVDLECRDDEHAIEVVSEHEWYSVMELWQRYRLVRRFEAKAAQRSPNP